MLSLTTNMVYFRSVDKGISTNDIIRDHSASGNVSLKPGKSLVNETEHIQYPWTRPEGLEIFKYT